MGPYQAKDFLILHLKIYSQCIHPRKIIEPKNNQLKRKTRALYSHDNGCQSGNENALPVSNINRNA
jgi:hypothetical protein